jgi:succinate dehydrogenase hydrophobic anchor subunit
MGKHILIVQEVIRWSRISPRSWILQRFTGEWAMLLQPEAILTVCREIGYTAWRDRVLTPVTTVQLFLWQILHGHTACRHLPHLSG